MGVRGSTHTNAGGLLRSGRAIMRNITLGPLAQMYVFENLSYLVCCLYKWRQCVFKLTQI